jgi:hypothetical protein
VDATEVKTWRRQERMRLIAWRMGLSPGVRREWGERITAGLQPFLTERPGVLGAYWPYRAEFDPQRRSARLLKGAPSVGVSPSDIRAQGLDYGELRRPRRQSWRRRLDHPSPYTAAV